MKYPFRNRSLSFVFTCLNCLANFLKQFSNSIPKPTTFRKILLCNGAHLGDVVLTTALIQPLQEAFPHLQLGIITGSWSKQVINNHPALHWIHEIDHWQLNRSSLSKKEKILRYLHSRKKVLKQIKEIGYDAAIDCRFHFPNMSWLLWQAKIPIRIGFNTAGFGALLTQPHPWDPKEDKPALSNFQELLKPLISDKKIGPLIPFLPFERKERKNYIVLHPGSGQAQKEWPKERWKKLAKQLTLDGYELIWTGAGKREESLILQIIKECPSSQNLCNRLEWSQFVQLISQAALLIGVDSVAGHVAHATQTPTILLNTGINPSTLWHGTRKNLTLLSSPVSCSPCLTGCPSMRCLQELSEERVLAKVKEMLLSSIADVQDQRPNEQC